MIYPLLKSETMELEDCDEIRKHRRSFNMCRKLVCFCGLEYSIRPINDLRVGELLLVGRPEAEDPS